jgi:beta-lactamase regulating signal transducer with metallopeptidase domain
MLELTLRSSVILAAAWALTRLMPRATAATRHLAWHFAVVATLLVPPITPLMPKLPLVPQVLQVGVIARDVAVATTETPHLVASSDRPSSHLRVASSPSSFLTVGTVSALGTLVFAVWFFAGWIAAARLSRRAVPAPLAWQLEVNTLRERLRIPGEVKLGIIPQPSSPLAIGLLRATILLPQTAAAWSADRRRAVLLHELAHIRRRDCRVQLIAQIACAVYWFNPLVWMAAAQLRSERERACDDEVLRLGAQASSYAAHLLDIARELRPQLRPSAALAMARPSELEGRLLSVLAAGRARVPFRGTRWAVVTMLTLATAVALSATAPEPAPDVSDVAAPSPRTEYVVSNDVVMSSAPAAAPRAQAEETLESSDDPQDRERATLALAFTSGRDVIPALLHALGDSDAQVREKAAIGLALRRDARVVEPLIAAMADPDSQVREKAAIALGTSGDPRAQDALTRALDDPDSQVREKAAAGLILFGLTR